MTTFFFFLNGGVVCSIMTMKVAQRVFPTFFFFVFVCSAGWVGACEICRPPFVWGVGLSLSLSHYFFFLFPLLCGDFN